MIKQYLWNFLAFLFVTQNVYAQNQNIFPFVDVPILPANSDNTTLKTYSTTLTASLIDPNSSFIETEFRTAINSYYGNRAGLGGFERIGAFSFRDRNAPTTTVTYDVIYNYRDLFNSVNGTDDRITNTIGGFPFVKAGLEADPLFRSRYVIVDEQTFLFQGNPICANGCPQGTYTVCFENTQGVVATCNALCRVQEYCTNGGWCHQISGNVEPRCTCPSGESEWYLGQFCQIKMYLWVPIVFFVGIFLILVIIVIITCCCVKHIVITKKEDKYPLTNVATTEPEPIVVENPQAYGEVENKNQSELTVLPVQDPEFRPNSTYSTPTENPPSDDVTSSTSASSSENEYESNVEPRAPMPTPPYRAPPAESAEPIPPTTAPPTNPYQDILDDDDEDSSESDVTVTTPESHVIEHRSPRAATLPYMGSLARSINSAYGTNRSTGSMKPRYSQVQKKREPRFVSEELEI